MLAVVSMGTDSFGLMVVTHRRGPSRALDAWSQITFRALRGLWSVPPGTGEEIHNV